ncbi:hypothetical protein V3C99_006813 [Haemonchus contortus]
MNSSFPLVIEEPATFTVIFSSNTENVTCDNPTWTVNDKKQGDSGPSLRFRRLKSGNYTICVEFDGQTMSVCGYVRVTDKPLFVLGGDPDLDKPDDHSATRNITKYLDESLNLTVTPSLKDEPYRITWNCHIYDTISSSPSIQSSNCFKSGAASTLNWTSTSIDFDRLSNFFIGPGVYEMEITVEYTVSRSTASQYIIITLLEASTTASDTEFWTSSSDQQRISEDEMLKSTTGLDSLKTTANISLLRSTSDVNFQKGASDRDFEKSTSEVSLKKGASNRDFKKTPSAAGVRGSTLDVDLKKSTLYSAPQSTLRTVDHQTSTMDIDFLKDTSYMDLEYTTLTDELQTNISVSSRTSAYLGPTMMNATTDRLSLKAGHTDDFDLSTTAASTHKELVTARTLSPEQKRKLLKHLQQIMKGLSSILNYTNPYGHDIIKRLAKLPGNQLSVVVNSLLNGRAEVSATMSSEQMIDDLKQYMNVTNEVIAKKLDGLLKELSKVGISSADAFSGVLNTLNNILKKTTSSTIKGQYQKQSGSMYGTMDCRDFQAAIFDMMVTISGDEVFIEGDIRSALLQLSPTATLVFNAGTIGFDGQYGKDAVITLLPGNYTKIELCTKQYGYRFESKPEIMQPGQSLSLRYHVELWNATEVSVVNRQKPLENTAVTAWIEITDAIIVLEASSPHYSNATVLFDTMRAGVSFAGESFTFTMTFVGVDYDIAYGAGEMRLSDVGNETTTLLYYGGRPQAKTKDGKSTTAVKNILDNLIAVENIDLAAFVSNSWPKMSLTPYNGGPLVGAFAFAGSALPTVSTIAEIDESLLTLAAGQVNSLYELQQAMGQSPTGLIVSGTLNLSKGQYKVFENATLFYEGNSLSLTSGTFMSSIANAQWELVSPDDGVFALRILSGKYFPESRRHNRTVLSFGAGKQAVIEQGFVFRNQSDGILIKGCQVVSGQSYLSKKQVAAVSLLNQAAQKTITGILGNATTYLKSHGSSLNMNQLNQAAKNVLSISNSLAEALKCTLNDPLWSDLQKNLDYEKKNYNEIFNYLPLNPGTIRYITELTQQQWAEQATRIVQEAIGHEMASHIQQLFLTLENTIAEKAVKSGDIPFNLTVTAKNNTMVLLIGNAEHLLNKPVSCEGWKVAFPSLVDLRVNLTDKDDFRLGMWCFTRNPYMYLDNFDVLVTSGSVSVQLEYMDGTPIPVTNTSKPINITGVGSTQSSTIAHGYPATFKSYQILDFFTFETVAWNISIFIEIEPYVEQQLTYQDAYAFIAFQRLPGPLAKDHDFMYHLNTTTSSFIYIPFNQLHNKTGLYYVGIGMVDKSSSNCVKYEPPPGIKQDDFCFVKGFAFTYNVRVLTKGCYYYQNSTDQIANRDDVADPYYGNKIVKCSVHHLTTFFVGLFSPLADTDFTYEYVNEHIPPNITAAIIVFCISLHMIFVIIFGLNQQVMDFDRGLLYTTVDNNPGDLYYYIVMVETGYRMCASTDSRVFITIYGSDADEVARELGTSHVKRNSSIFSWGISARFLLRTPWCLGDLRYVRLWVDNSGRGECESWYCNRVIIKDLHTGKIYRFPIYNWFGSFMGDGESERLAAVDNVIKMKNEVMSIHILAETISYIAMYTGGGLRTRQRVRRSAYSVSILMGQYIICFVNWAIAATGDYNGLSKRENLGLGITVTDGDVFVGMLLSILILPFTSLIPWIYSHIPSYYELEEIELLKNRNIKRNLPKYWPYGLGIILELVLEYVLIGFFILNMGLTCSLPADAVEAFTHRYMIQLFLWIFITEPIKGMVAAYIILKRNPCHAISSDFDEAILPLEYGKNLSPPPECLRNDVVGTTDADIAQLNQNRDKKTREELLFETLRNVAYLLVALVITLGLVYFYRDVSGYYYQQQVQTLLNLPPSGPYGPQAFQSISQISQFWNWTQSTLVPSLAATWYDGNPAWGMRGFANDKVSREMGIGHIRQIRSLPMKECDVEPQLRQYFQNCYADISSSNEDRTPQYAAGWKKYNATSDSSPPAEYRYQTAEELQSINIDGQLQSYSGGGYCVLLQGPNVDLMAELQKLQAENWIDKNTRAIFVEFSMYNAQVNYFSVVQLIIEIPSEGYLLPSSWVESVRLIRSQGSDGKIIVVFEFLYVIYAVLSFFVNTINYISNVVTAYQNRPPGHHIMRLFTHLFIARFWDILDLFVGILAVLSVIAFFLREIYIDKALKNFAATNGNVYINLALQRNMELFFTFCLAGVVFFVACKMIKILRFNRRISVLANTLDYARVSITDFAVVFVIIICAFNASLYCLLWDRLASYQSVIATFATTTSGMLGKFVVANMFQISPLAFIIFMTFLYTATLILINIFVMIVLYEFKQVRCDSSRQTNEYEILEHIQTKIMRSVGLYGRHNMPACCVPDTLKDAELLNTLVSKTDLLLHRAYRWRVEDDDDDDMVIPGPRAQDLPKYAW